MTKFLDSHQMGGFDKEALKKAQKAPPDEYGVTHHNILYNEKE